MAAINSFSVFVVRCSCICRAAAPMWWSRIPALAGFSPVLLSQHT